MENYEIQLGVDLDTSDLKTKINSLDGKYNVKLGVDLKVNDIRDRIRQYNTNSNNAKVKLGIKLDTSDLKQQIAKLNLGGSSNAKGVAIPVNTQSLENSLKEVKGIITDIKTALGTLDSSGDMKSLLTSVNQIASALDKATDESNGLLKSLDALSKKDFNFNFGLDMGKKNNNMIAYGRAARKQVIPELELQIKELENIFGGQQAVMNRLVSQGSKVGFDVFTDFNDFNADSAIKRMEAMEKYINSMKKLAAIDNVDLSSFDNQFSKSASELINDITGVENAVDKAGDIPDKLKSLFGGSVDGEGLSKQLDSIVVDLGEIKTVIQGMQSGVSLEGLTQSFDRLSDSIELLVKNCTTAKQVINDTVGNVGKSVSQGSGETAIKETSNELKKLKDLARQIGQLDFKIVKSDFKNEVNQVKEFERQLELLKIQYNETLNSIDGQDIDIGSDITREFTEARNKIAEFEAKIADTKRQLANNIKTNIGTDITKNINKVHFEFDKLSNKSIELKQKLDLLDDIKVDLNTAAANDDIESLINLNERYKQVLKEVQTQININKTTEQAGNNADDLALRKESAMLRLKNLFGENSEAARRFAAELNEIQRELAECGDTKGLQMVEQKITNLSRQANAAGYQTKTLGQKLKKQFQQYTSYFSIASLFQYGEQALRSMFEQVKLIDSAMTELKKVTNETDATYKEFLTNAATRSREIGTTIDGLVSSTADFARLGYGFKDAQGLAEVANIYAVVGDEIEGVEGATESLISTMAAFKDSANNMSNSDFAMSIIDKFNEIGNNFAISSGGIGEALERSASSLDAANNTIDESIALITASNQVVQDPAAVGQALKTISMRIRGAKTEMEEAGLETDGMVESTAKLREEIMTLTGVDIMLDANNFKSTYQIMDELASKWESLSDIAQASVTELIAGKRQGNIVSSLMSNFDTARDALETSLNSAGSAMAEHEKWQQSLEAQINKLKASWQGLSQAFLKSDFLKSAFDLIINLVDGLTLLIDKVGVLPTLLTGFSIFKSFGNKGLFKTFDNNLDGFTNKVGIANKSFSELMNSFKSANTGGFKGFINGLKSMGNALANPLSQSDLSAIELYNKLIDDGVDGQVAFAQTMKGTSNAAQGLVKSANGSKVAIDGMKTASIGAKAALVGAKVAATLFNAALTMGISLLIDWAVSGIMKVVNADKELAESVEEITSKFKEQHNELKKLQGDYDISNESSMISKYEKLSKGVDGLGRNISLTAEEYSEYQSIVNNIADQIPSLVSGYDEQGNALLSCKGNVESLTEAYEKLIHAQNQEILTNTSNIEKDFENTLKDSEKGSFLGMGKKVSTPSIELLEKVLNGNYSEKDIENLLKGLTTGQEDGVYEALYSAGIGDMGRVYDTEEVAETLAKQLKADKSKIKGIIDDYYGQFSDAVEEQKTIAQAVLSEAFDVSSAISGLKYGNISEELQQIAQQTVSGLDYNFFTNLKEQGKSVEQWTKEMLNSLNSLSETDNKQIETGFELQTKFNGGDISYGQYISQLQETVDFIDKDLKVPDEVKNQIKLSLNSEDILADYNALVHDLKNIGFDDTSINKFLNSLSAEEFFAAMKIIPDLDADATINEIQALIDEQLATEFKFDITVQTEGLEAFNTALTESRSAAGLTSESITALKARYEDLDGFNAAALFEKTANGIHLNSEELSRLEEQYINTNKLDIENNLNKLVTKYNDLTEEIKGCTDAQEKENLQLQADTYKDKIDELSTLASQYDGLTSAFAKWQTALDGAEEGDNYDSLYENLESIKELYDKGLVGTDKFKTAAQLMTNKDLANADIDEIVNAYKKGYPKMQRYFTEGQKGCKNFLNDVRNLNSEWAHMNKDGSWEINFNAEEVAKELGVSVDFVLQIAKKLKDYGFEVNLEDSSVDNLKTKIEQTEAKLKKLGQAPVDINVDIEANSENLGTIESEIEKAKSKIKEINNSSVEPKVKTAQLEDAQAKLEALINKKIEASQPAFMNLNTSQVNASLVDALEKIQSYQDAINEVNKLSELKEAGIVIDDSQLQTAKEKVDECAKTIQGLDGEVKMAIGLEEDGSIDSIKKSFEEGKVKIDANTDPAITKIEQLAENVDRIEDKDVVINVKVNGLDKVKELNKQIDLATDIDGDIDKLFKYVESAKALNKIGDNITSYVTANVKGNVTETPEFKINNLKVFADSVKDLKDTGSFTSNVKVDVKGNVIETPEYKLNNLKVFTDSAKDLDDIGSAKSEVTAEIKGNVIDEFEYKINNLKVFSDNAKDLHKVGDVEAKVKANIEGNVVDEFEYKLNNLKVFTDNAKDIHKIGNVESNVTATVNTGEDGDVIDTFEYKLNNLGEFAKHAKELQGLDDIDLDVKATVNTGDDGDVVDTFEYKLDNLSEFATHVKDLQGLQDVNVNITATVNTGDNGDVVDEFEYKLNNLEVFAKGAKALQGVGNISSEVTAKVNTGEDGDAVDTFEYKLNNLETFADGAKALQGIGNVDVSVSAKVNTGESGDVIDTFEYKLDNLDEFADYAKELQGLENVDISIKANVNTGEDGDVVDTFEYKLNNLGDFADYAKSLQGLESVDITITANAKGNVVGEKTEGKINNLEVFAKGAKKIQSLESKDVTITANAKGNVVGKKTEGKINNLEVFAKGAKSLQGIGSKTVEVTANAYGNVVGKKTEGKINNLKVFGDSAKALNGVSSKTVEITANAHGNVVSGDSASSKLSSLTEFKSIISGMSNQTVTVSVTANVDAEKINSAIDLLNKVANSGVFKDYKATVQVGAKVSKIDDTTVKNYKAPPKNGKVKYSVDPESSVFTWTAPNKNGVVNYSAEVEALTNAQKHKTGTITYKAKVEGKPKADGTAHSNGTTSGRAYARGDWGIKGNGVALGGELGREIVVRDGKFFTIGDAGAEFFQYRKNDIIFNAAQTESLFKYGGIKGANPRGKMLATGTAFAEGNAFVTGGGKFYNSSTGESYGSTSDSSSDSSKDFEEVIDWIEVIIDRVERSIDKFDQQANNIYKSWSSRNNALLNQISEVNKEIGLQQQAKIEYEKAANGVGLDTTNAAKVRNGTIDIKTIKDEILAEKIKSYQDYYEKALDCEKAIEELKETESELYAQRVENVATQYEGILGIIEHEKNMIEEYISQSEANAQLISGEYYKALISNENETVTELQKQKNAMLSELQTAMNSGKITKYSEGWYEIISSVDEVTLSIAESQTQIKEWNQTIQQLSWEIFDLLQDKISAVTEEADFLIELMSSDKLHDDNGKLTDEGSATMGLHGVAYNTYMYQSELAAKEAKRLKKQMSTDGYDTELEERYREMITLQQEYILNAEDEKNAIRDLVSDGIELELDALQELIDKKNEELESEKDLYEYQKKVKEQTEEIADIEKMLSSYSNDTSEEARAKIQELKVSLDEAKADLEETEYDKYISDQGAMLDELYLSYETLLNERLDNLNALVEQTIAQINMDATSISTTLSEKADSVGYTLSNSMTSIWDTNSTKINSVITTYGERFTSAQTTTNNALSTINSNLQNMITQLNSIAKTNTKSASTSSAANNKKADTPKPSTPATPKPSTPSTPTVKVGGMVNASGAKIYDYAGDTSGERQLYRSDPKYRVLKENGNWIQVRWHKLSSGITGWFKKSDVKAYKTGVKNLLDNEVAWTQENGGREFIVRPSDGAILTPLAKGDSVLNANASGNIWDMANNPSEFIRDNLGLGNTGVPNSTNVNNTYSQTIEKVVFDMSGIKNYEQMLQSFSKDPKFEKLINAMTIDRIAGGSSLAKGKVLK